MSEKITNRGFRRVDFKDANDEECSLQESSWCTPAIWLGQDKPTIVKGAQGKDKYLCRMHLTQEQVKKLLPYLKKFVKRGYLK